MLTVTVTFDEDHRLVNTEVKVKGVPGNECMNVTTTLRKLNPDAIVQPTSEMFDNAKEKTRNKMVV